MVDIKQALLLMYFNSLHEKVIYIALQHFDTSIQHTNAIRGTLKLPNQRAQKAGFYLVYSAKKNRAISQVFKHVILPVTSLGRVNCHLSPESLGLIAPPTYLDWSG